MANLEFPVSKSLKPADIANIQNEKQNKEGKIREYFVKTMDGGEVNAVSIETKATIEILIHARRGRFGQNEIKVVLDHELEESLGFRSKAHKLSMGHQMMAP